MRSDTDHSWLYRDLAGKARGMLLEESRMLNSEWEPTEAEVILIALNAYILDLEHRTAVLRRSMAIDPTPDH